MKKLQHAPFLTILFALALTALCTSCDSGSDGGGSSGNIGDNRRGVVLVVGDSIPNGSCFPAGAPYPARIGAINAGVCGETAAGGSAKVGALLEQYQPEVLIIAYGANDVIQGRDLEDAISDLQSIIDQGKANQSRVLVANILPMYESHAPFQPRVGALNPLIRQLTKTEKVGFVNLESAFGTDPALFQEDGLHPTDEGNQIIARALMNRL